MEWRVQKSAQVLQKVQEPRSKLRVMTSSPEGVHGAARLTEELGDSFSDKREIHYICPLFCLSISVALTRPSMMASGLGAQPAMSTSTWTYLLRGAQTE